jgi:hypothetical protein
MKMPKIVKKAGGNRAVFIDIPRKYGNLVEMRRGRVAHSVGINTHH